MSDSKTPKGSDNEVVASDEPIKPRKLNEVTRDLIRVEDARRRTAKNDKPLHPRSPEDDKRGFEL